MPAKTDPLTEIRRERFRAYCISKRWGDGKEWRAGEIAQAIGKPITKTSDLLNAHGSFGAKIAREIEDKLSLPGGYLDGFSGWPFPGIQAERFHALTHDQRMEIQGIVRQWIEKFEGGAGNGGASQLQMAA